MKTNKKGFTLAELVISLAILAIIASALMTLTATTFQKVYNRRMQFLFKNECQNIASCFAISEVVINSYTGEMNVESFIESLDFYFTENISHQEYIEEGIVLDTDFIDSVEVNTMQSPSGDNIVTINWTYNVTFNQDGNSTQYCFCVYINYEFNQYSAYNTAEVSLIILKGGNGITSLEEVEKNTKVVYTALKCLTKEVQTI